MCDRPIKVRDVAIGARLHHAPLHHVQRKLGEPAKIGVRPETMLGGAEAFLDRIDPIREILRQAFANDRVRIVSTSCFPGKK